MAQSAQIAKVNPWHQRLADWLIIYGTQKGWNAKAAEHFNVTQAWLSTVVHSDAFLDYYQRRNDEHSKALLSSVAEKIAGAAGQAIDLLAERLETEGKVLPYETLLETVDVLGKRAGLGEGGKAQAQTTVNVALVSREELELYRARMRKSSESSEPLELQANELPTPRIGEVGDA